MEYGEAALLRAIQRLNRPVCVIETERGQAISGNEPLRLLPDPGLEADAAPVRGFAPALDPARLGDAGFCHAHGVAFPYVAGAMANAISSVELVIAMGRARVLGMFGAAGLSIAEIDAAIDRIQSALGDLPYGFNLIHSPGEPRLEAETVALYLRRGVRRVSASAFLDVTPPLVRYRVSGLHRTPAGEVRAANQVLAKVSRVEVARKFFSPPPAAMLDELARSGQITPEEARLARAIPLAEDLTAEADSGGHTDNRPALALVPTMLALRDALAREFEYDRPLRVGAAGGIATPQAAAAAFAMGAAYVLTGSVNQACREAGTAPVVRRMLAEASQADVMMAPAADMFELGVKLQVLKRGTMFGVRATKLYELYRRYDSIAALPPRDRQALERDYFRCTLDEAWAQTQGYFAVRDPSQIERAEHDPQHKFALLLRSYLGQSSHWANAGEPSRQVDYQIWCGPAMGAFNEWVRGTFLEPADARDVVTVAMNLVVGAAVVTRAHWLRAQGVRLPQAALGFAPRPLAELQALLRETPAEVTA